MLKAGLIWAAFIIVMAPSAYAQPVKRIQDCTECPDMVVIPPGSFVMGSTPSETAAEMPPADIAAMEHPQHRVTIAQPFAVGRTEITRGQYEVFVRDTNRPDGERCFVWDEAAAKWDNKPGVTWREPGFKQGPDEPAVCVSWNDASAYAAWLSARTQQPYRLPTEAEWEYAARGGATTARPWPGETILASRSPACASANVSDSARAALHPKSVSADPQAFFPCRDGVVFTAAVGRFAANAFGLHDMIGNVWEWTADCEHDSYDKAPTDGSAWLTGGDCTQRSNRGGSWADPMWRVRSAVREWDPAGGRYAINGFRVARDLKP